MAKTNCGTCNHLGYLSQMIGPHPDAINCNRGCKCKLFAPNSFGTFQAKCVPNVAQQNRDRHLNASGFMGTGVSTLKVIWWGVGALVVLAVVAKGLKVYRSAKYY